MKEYISTRGSWCEYSRLPTCRRSGYSQLASAAVLRPTWRPGKLTGKLRLPMIELFLRQGPGPQKRTAQDILRSFPEINRAGLKLSSEPPWTFRLNNSLIHPISYRKFTLKNCVHYPIKEKSNHCLIHWFSKWMLWISKSIYSWSQHFNKIHSLFFFIHIHLKTKVSA